MYPFAFYPPRPVVAKYPCPDNTPIMDAFPTELQALFNAIPTMMMYDRDNQLTSFYRDQYQRENTLANPPSVQGKFLHLLVFHDPDVYQRERQYKIISPAKARELVNKLFTHEKIVDDPYGNAYLQIEKMILGGTTVNITFLFCRMDAYFYLRSNNTHLLEIKANRFLFKDAPTFMNIFGPPPQIDSLNEAELVGLSPVQTPSLNPPQLVLEKEPSPIIDKAEHVEWNEAIKSIPAEMHSQTDTTFAESSYFSVLPVDPVAEDNQASSIYSFKSGSNKVTTRKPTTHPHKVTTTETPTNSAQNVTTNLSDMVFASTRYVWSLASEKFSYRISQFQKSQQSAKRLSMMNLYAQRQPKQPSAQIAAPELKDPLEKFLKNHVPSIKLNALFLDITSEPFRESVLSKLEALDADARSKQFNNETLLVINQSSLQQYYIILISSVLGLVSILYLFFFEPKNKNSEALNYLGAISCFMILKCLHAIRNPPKMADENEVLISAFQTTLYEITLNINHDEQLFLLITVALIFLKEMQIKQIGLSQHSESSFANCMMSISQLIDNNPCATVSQPFNGLLDRPDLSRQKAIRNTMCCLLLIHGTDLPMMISENKVPEINIVYMTTAEQIELMKTQINAISTLINQNMLNQKRKITAEKTDVIFNHMDTIMLVYALRREPVEDPFFASFRQDYEHLVKYADNKIATYIQTQRDHVEWPQNCTNINQTPIKSKLFSAAWMENRPVALQALKKMTGIDQTATANMTKLKCN
jgi:hypothetical protein